jgi:hypothetical protein
MRLTPAQGPSPLRRERLLLAAGLLLSGALLFSLLWRPSSPSASKSTLLSCGAEQQQGEYFVHNDYQFSGATYRTRERARNGRYSISLPADGQNHYGFTVNLRDVQPGEVYEVSVWSFGNSQKSGKLAIQGREPAGFYEETAAATTQDQKGWEQHLVRFNIPFQNAPQELSIYVYTNGSQQVFFDDLRIEKVTQWDASAFQPTQIQLRLDDKALGQLEEKRDEALRKGLLQTGEGDWVDATLSENDTTREVKLRLKGDWLDHLRGDKWSFRIKLKGQQAWRGLRTFSLHTPAARYYLHEWLLHQYWQDLGVLTPRYDLIELIINGESRGIYAYEEHFEKQLVEAQQRREGPIVKFQEDGFWAGISRQFAHHGFVRPGSNYSADNPANAPITAFNEEELLADTTQARLLQDALSLLEQYRQGDKSAGDIFDLPLLARYYAGCDLFNAYHGIVWHNQRFYYNPITAKLEPIGFDGFADAPSRRYHFLAEGTLHREAPESTSLPAFLLQDSAFMTTYISVLKDLTLPQNWETFFRKHEAAWTARLQWLQLEFPNYQPEQNTFAEEVAFVRSHLLPFRENVLRSYQTSPEEVLIENTHTLPIVLKGYGTSADYQTGTFPAPIWLPAGAVRSMFSKLQTNSEVLPFRSLDFWDRQALAFQDIPSMKPVKVPEQANFIFLQLPGWDTLISAPIRRLEPPQTTQISAQAYQTGSKPEDFEQLHWDIEAQMVTIPAGEHRFSRDLIIPKGYGLRITAGANIFLENTAAIISYGPVRALGEEETPIYIQSEDGTGQGLQVIQSPTGSILRGVVFRNLRNLRKGNWQLTGAVTFYESAVQIVGCRFLDNQSEDALNIVRSTFEMTHSLIQNTSSDGLDADFCKGIIQESAFRKTGNDGVDFSGSIITLEKVEMQGCGDKGVSAGEASDITLIDASVSDCNIGLASKDQSTLYVRRGQLQNCLQGMVVFQKKPEFGPAYLLVEQLTIENVARLYQIGPGSRLQIDEKLYFE